VRFAIAASAFLLYAVSPNDTFGQAQAGLYYIHVDHLNTPRAIYDQSQQLVWRWDQSEPFGNTPPNENPVGLGNFECNLRFPGQYFDKETNRAYNYFRDFDPSLGRYMQSDPVGVRGGRNTYSYAWNIPLALTDRLGLDPGDLFASQNDAAWDAAIYARRQPIKIREYGGWIFQKEGTCWTYNFVAGKETTIPWPHLQAAKPDDPNRRLWHTHPPLYATHQPDIFSPGDEAVARREGPMYLHTPQNELKLFDPTSPRKFPEIIPYREPKRCQPQCK